MERTDLDQWRGRDVARLLALVETQRRYYQEIVASIPVGLLVLSTDLSILLANSAARKIFGLHTGGSPRRIDAVLPASMLDRIEEVLNTGVAQTGMIVENGRDKRRLRVGILAIRNWDEEAAQEALLTVEDLSDVGAPPAVVLTLAPVAEALPEAPAIEDVPGSEELPTTEAQTSEPAAASKPSPVMPAVAAISAQQLIENADAIIWAVELPSMNFVFASPQAEKLLGFAPEHWTSHPSFWLDRVRDSDRDWVAQSYQRAIETGSAHSCEFQAITAGGSSVWLREYARVLPAAEGSAEGQPRYMIGVAVDVTERRMLEDQLLQSERVEAVSRLASRMAHDLNNMLMILTGYSEELLTSLPAGSTLRADVQEILAATDRMSGLTSQLLSFARRQSIAAVEMDLESTLGRFGPRLSALLGTHVGLELRLAGEPNRVRADMAQLEQVITAIVERARQAMHAGEKIVLETSRMEVTEDLRRPNAPLQPGNYAVISVIAPGHRWMPKLKQRCSNAHCRERNRGTTWRLPCLAPMESSGNGAAIFRSPMARDPRRCSASSCRAWNRPPVQWPPNRLSLSNRRPPLLSLPPRLPPFWWWRMKLASAHWFERFCDARAMKCWKRPTARMRWRFAANTASAWNCSSPMS